MKPEDVWKEKDESYLDYLDKQMNQIKNQIDKIKDLKTFKVSPEGTLGAADLDFIKHNIRAQADAVSKKGREISSSIVSIWLLDIVHMLEERTSIES